MPRINLWTNEGGQTCFNGGSSFYAWRSRDEDSDIIFALSVDTDEIRNYTNNTEHSYQIRAGASSLRWSHASSLHGDDAVNNISKKEKFFVEKVKKSAMSLKGLSALITQSFEIESMTKNDSDNIKRELRNINGGVASNKQVNDGNGWNGDSHFDGSLSSYSSDNGGCYGTETSASPIDIVSYSDIKDYLQGILETYKQASGNVYHTMYGSTHVHNTVSYIKDGYDIVSAVDVDSANVYNNVARFFLKFMPIMKWLCMTDRRGGRRVRGTSYDLMENDDLFSWYSRFGDDSTSQSSIRFLKQMSRDSYLRILGSSQIHFENRMCDTTFNSTHLAMWLTINKAITLLAVDFARKNYILSLDNTIVENTRELMIQHRRGYENVDRNRLGVMYKEFVSYLAKYFKVLGSLEVIEVMDKLVKCPISQWINENGYDYHWNTDLIEKVFNTRNRACDVDLRNKFMDAIQFLEVPYADKLDDFHENMAKYLNVEVKKVKSLYQMFKKENVDIEFLGGRLVYLGD